jgi:hypothetical protein
MEQEKKTLLKPMETRWLSVQAAIQRLLSIWNPIYKYFSAVKESWLIEQMDDKSVKIYLEFLHVYLGKFTEITKIFQKEASQVPSLRDEISKLYWKLSTDISYS